MEGIWFKNFWFQPLVYNFDGPKIPELTTQFDSPRVARFFPITTSLIWSTKGSNKKTTFQGKLNQKTSFSVLVLVSWYQTYRFFFYFDSSPLSISCFAKNTERISSFKVRVWNFLLLLANSSEIFCSLLWNPDGSEMTKIAISLVNRRYSFSFSVSYACFLLP